jgi:hypothetical protein
MLTRFSERSQDTPLRAELLCGEAYFPTLAEAIASGIFIGRGKRLHYGKLKCQELIEQTPS